MSLYNALFGVGSNAHRLLEILGLHCHNDIPRPRDLLVKGEHIVIYTRSGGGNREFYESEESRRANCPETTDFAPPYNADLRKHPCFVYDEDASFDSTYAYFYFRFPDEYRDELRAMSAQNEKTPCEKWHSILSDAQNSPPSNDRTPESHSPT